MPRPQLKISVPQPCSENWSAMTPQAKGRFCASCATTVVDFSQFTDKQLLEYFANRSGKTCGRFSVSQLNRPVYAETLPKQNFFPRALAAAALFLGISSQTQAQNTYDHPTPAGQVIEKKVSEEEAPAKTVGKTPEKVSGDSLVISGRLLDAVTKEPLPFEKISIKGTSVSVLSDINGVYKINLPNDYKNKLISVVISSNNYEKVDVKFKRNKLPLMHDFYLDFNGPVMGELITEYRKTPGYYLRSFWWKTKNLFRKND